MKKLPLLLLVTTLTAMIAARAETVIFDDTFGGGSTLNNATPANPDTNSTAYQMLSSKSWSGQSVGANQLRIGMVATSSGIMECQALFTTNPVTLDVEHDAIELRVTFTNTAGLLSGTSQLGFGLYNSGGANGSVKPVPAGLNATLLNSLATAASGNAQSWQGYFGQMFPSGGNHRIANRAAQTGANNQNQATVTSGTSSSPGNPVPASVSANVLSDLSLTVGATYTEVLKITRNGAGDLAITNTLYSGPEPGGAAVATVGGIATGATLLTTAFDSLSFGWRAATATTMDLSRITVTKYTRADLPALYNIQLNGLVSTYAGVGYIGSPGDVWNNPTLSNMANDNFNYGHTTQTLATAVALVDSTGAASAATFSMTAADYKSAHAALGGAPIVGLTDRALKFDWTGSAPAPNWQMTIAGLPANKLITVYAYTAAGSGGGSDWILNGGADSATIVNDGSGDANNITLSKNKGISWEVLSGTTDGTGTFTIDGKPGTGASIWWQTYVSGLQIQVGGTAPTIIGLVNQTVEDGATVNLTPIVTGNPVPNYQWYENGTLMPAETNPTLTLANVTTGQNGNVYSLVAENAIGVASNSMTLTVNASVFSTMTVTAVSPTNGATGICYDTPLTVTFSDTVTLGTIGAIKIFNASNPTTPVDTINAANGLAQQRTFPGDGQSFTHPTISISGNTVTINPHFNTLTSNTTYYVTIDPKTFKDSGGTNFVGLTNTNLWQFSTKSGPADPDNLVVTGDGSGDFVTVQGAVNSVPNGNTTPRVISVRDGLYHEIVNISGKHNVTLRGQSRTGTLIGFANNATYQAANGGTTHARMSFKVNANDVSLESLTLTNMTPQGGSQAEALMLETGAARCIVNNCEIVSRQDTILANTSTSQGYFYQSTIKGNFDYIWGGGNLFFTNCTIHTISGSSSFNVTAARTTTSGSSSTNFPWLNPGGTYTADGMSFVNCNFTADSGVTTVTLAGGNGTAGNNVSWFGCEFSTKYVAPAVLFSGNYLFWQAENTQNASPVSFANITTHAGTDPEMLAATNVTVWLYGWTPVLATPTPNQPVISGPTTLPDGNFEFSASGDNGQSYRAWATDDVTLTPVISTWTLLTNGTFGASPVIITDLDATNHVQRFYLITIP